MTEFRRSSSSIPKKLLDIANVFKAFVGTNYLAVSFAFSQSGTVLGVIGIVIIALTTAHCCHLIVKCKREATRQLLQPLGVRAPPRQHNATSDKEDERETGVKDALSRARLKNRIDKHLSYGDVAWVAMGKWGLALVNFALVVTQMGYAVGYTIFLGNTLQRMIHPVNENLTTTTPMMTTVMTTSPNISSFERGDDSLLNDVTYENTQAGTSPVHPRYEVLVAAMVPLFILLAFLRNVRQHLGPVSFVSNTAVVLAFCAVMAYISIDFEIDSAVEMFSWATFPIFFGQLTYAYAGIGAIIPIESSMTGNRHLFAPFLYTSLTLFTLLLSSIGITGYMKYGLATQQIIIWNLPLEGVIPYILDSVICLAVLLTLPLANYPAIEILEGLLFAQGRIFGPSKAKYIDPKSGISTVQRDTDPLLADDDIETATILKKLPVANVIPDSVAAWKRNLFRALLVCVEAGVAIAFKDEYAYFSAYVGAIGSTLLAYIMPCIIHLKLHGRALSTPIIIKDAVVILFGVAGGVASVFASTLAIFGEI